MKTIWKYSISAASSHVIKMPKGAQVLTVQVQFKEPMLWALVDPNEPLEDRQFKLFGTGEDIPDQWDYQRLNYINTFQVNNGVYVFHLFELK